MALSEKYGAKRAYSRAADLVAWEGGRGSFRGYSEERRCERRYEGQVGASLQVTQTVSAEQKATIFWGGGALEIIC